VKDERLTTDEEQDVHWDWQRKPPPRQCRGEARWRSLANQCARIMPNLINLRRVEKWSQIHVRIRINTKI